MKNHAEAAAHSASPAALATRVRPLHVFVVLTLAAVLRLAITWALADDLLRDVDGYRKLAIHLRNDAVLGWPDSTATGRVRPTAFRPPLYPIVLSILVSGDELRPAAVAALHLAMGLGTVALTLAAARRCGLGRWSIVAAMLVAADPLLLHQTPQVMTETFAAMLAAAALLAWTYCTPSARLRWFACAGGVTAMAALCRPTFVPWAGLCGLVLLFLPASPGTRIRRAIVFSAAVMLVLLPWAVRNFAQFGHLKLTTTHGGYTLLLANNPGFYQYLESGAWGSVWASTELDEAWQRRSLAPEPEDPRWSKLSLAHLPLPSPSPADEARDHEFRDDRFAYSLAKRFIRERPGMFVYSCLVRIGRLWSILPHATEASESLPRQAIRYAVAIWYACIFTLAAIGLCYRRQELLAGPWVWGMMLCIAFTVVHSVYWTDLRMRAPLTPFLALLAAAGAAGLAARQPRP
jgi:hypothetical protein